MKRAALTAFDGGRGQGRLALQFPPLPLASDDGTLRSCSSGGS